MIDKVIIMSFIGKSNSAILKEIGQRLRLIRLEQNISQDDLAKRAGISRMTVSFVENGRSVATLTLIQILRALGMLDSLNSFLPEPIISPLQIARLKGKERQRASGSFSRDDL